MKLIITLCMLMLASIAYTQTVTIDYEAWNPSNPPCRIFPGITNVPATGAPGGVIQHITSIGQPYYSTSDKSVQIKTTYVAAGAGTWNGGSFRIYYNFKDGYSYTIYVTAAAVENTVGFQTGPYFRLDVDNASGGLASNAPCNGPDQVTQNLSGNPAAQKVVDDEMTEFQFNMPALGTQSTLNITAIPEQNGGTKTVRIRKIRIEETPPPVSFTLPSSTTFACGSTTAIPFTVNNVYGTTGVTNYTWNLGSTPNGWLYNNVAAPATVSTGATISLTPACNTVPKNITATVTANGNIYNTNINTVSVTQPSMSINGSSSFCTGSQAYSITGLPCSATVAWTTSPSNIVTPATSTSATPTFTKSLDGDVTLSAVVTSCGVVRPAITKMIHVGAYTSSDYTLTGNNGSAYFCPSQTVSYALGGATSSNYVWTVPTGWTTLYNGGSYATFRTQSSSTPATGNVAVTFTQPCGGTTVTKSTFVIFNTGCSANSPYSVTPNPASTTITISCISLATYCNIAAVQITSTSGTILSSQTWSNTNQTVQMPVGFLQNGTYLARVYNGTQWYANQFVVQH